MTSLLLRGGRVIDPGRGLDAERDLLIVDGRIAEQAEDPPDKILDVRGCIVGPGFIDLHSHVHSIAGHRLQALDGVTTALDLEAGMYPLAKAYADAAAEGRPLNYGFSASWAASRAWVHYGLDQNASVATALQMLSDPRWQRTSTLRERGAWLDLLSAQLDEGALGIGVLLGYAPRTDPAEMLAVAHLARRADVAAFTHVREIVEADPDTTFDGPTEITRLAAETGAHMHHCHVNSTSRRHIDRVLRTLDSATKAGARVTVETYPYGAGSTAVGAYFLAPERIDRWGIGPQSIHVARTGEALTLERLQVLRRSAPETPVVVHFLDEQADLRLLEMAMAFPDAVVASDAMPIVWPDQSTDTPLWPLPHGGQTHPRTSGTFLKALRLMVGSGQWTWVEAFRRCSLLPAQILDYVPAAHSKGHLGSGADADVVVLDPDLVTERATYEHPTAPSIGVRHLLVAGEPVVTDGAIVVHARPGRPLRRA